MAKKIAEQLIETLVESGVERIYAVTGDSLNEVNEAVRKNNKIQWIHVRHEETGAYAAAAEAQLTGRIGCCAGSSGPGHVHLINGLYDAQRSGAPVIAIASTIPSGEFGTEYFQETNTIKLFNDCSYYNEVATTPGQFPRMLQSAIQYSLAKSGLVIRYGATTDAPTVCNMTNHSYFNLNGHASGSALGHRVTVDADFYLEADAASIPTGRKLPVKGTPMDFTEEKTLGLDIGADFTPLTDCCGYDQCYVIRDSGLRHAAWAVGPETGIRMEVLTTLPGVHLYTANFLAPVTAGKDGAHYAARDAVCFETEDFPDAPNHPNFPDTTLLPDKPYSSTTIYRFDLAEM